MRRLRYALLMAVLTGLVLSLLLGRSPVHTKASAAAYGSGIAFTGVGNSTVPPRDLFIAAGSQGTSLVDFTPLFAFAFLLLAAGGTILFLRLRRRG